jgi:hypothetical protein
VLLEVRALAAMTLQFEVGPETRALIERVAGKVVVEIELGPKAREVLEELARTRAGEARPPGAESPVAPGG